MLFYLTWVTPSTEVAGVYINSFVSFSSTFIKLSLSTKLSLNEHLCAIIPDYYFFNDSMILGVSH
jgi:hypothetical protein